MIVFRGKYCNMVVFYMNRCRTPTMDINVVIRICKGELMVIFNSMMYLNIYNNESRGHSIKKAVQLIMI